MSEAYYGHKQAEQLKRIRDAMVSTDLVVLEDTLDLKQTGLVRRVDLLRRSNRLGEYVESLIEAMADRAVERQELRNALKLSTELFPVLAIRSASNHDGP